MMGWVVLFLTFLFILFLIQLKLVLRTRDTRGVVVLCFLYLLLTGLGTLLIINVIIPSPLDALQTWILPVRNKMFG